MADISTNLLYYYKFDKQDISGTKLKNWATGSYDATLSSSSVISNRNFYIGNSSMDCTYGGMSFPVTLGGDGFSFSFWLSATHLQNAFYFNSSFINFSHYNNKLRIYGLLDFSMANDGNSSTWKHIIITWSNTNVITFYLNGKKNTTNTNAAYPNVGNVTLNILDGSYFFDDFRIYNYVITSESDINYLLYYPNYKIYTNSLSSASLLSKLNSNFYDTNNQNIIFDNEPRNIIPGTIVLLSGKPTSTTSNLGSYANSVTYSSISQAIFNSQYSSLYVVDDISGSISVINMQTGIINVLPTMDPSSNAVENRYNLQPGIKSIAFDISQKYYYVTNGSYVQQMDYQTNQFIKNINTDALISVQYCITDSSNILYIAHSTGINKINLSGVLPTATTNVITTAISMSKITNSPVYPNKLFAINTNSGKIYIINTITDASYVLTLPGYVITALCFDTLGHLYISTTNRMIFLIPSRVFTNYTVDTTLQQTTNYKGTYDWMNYAGTSVTGSSGDGGLCSSATFSNISHIMMDAGNNMYICDTSNCTIRKIINKPQTTNFLNTIIDEMNVSSQYDISTLYSSTYSIGTNQITNYCIGTNTSKIGTEIKSSNYNIIDNSGLLLYYRFNSQDMSGVNLANYSTEFPVYDASLSVTGLVNSNDFALDNAALNIPSTGFVTINNSILTSGSVFNTNGLSFAFWVKSNNTSTNGRIFEFGNQVSATYAILISIVSNKLTLKIIINNVGTTYDTSYNINNNVWRHICWTLTYSTGSTSTYNVYIDGSIIYTITSGIYPSSIVTYPLCYIGKSTYSIDPSFNGVIDDFRFYNRILSQSEVSTLYNNIKSQNEVVDLNNYLTTDLTSGAIPTLTVSGSETSPATYTITNNSTSILNGSYIVSWSGSDNTYIGPYIFDNNDSTFAIGDVSMNDWWQIQLPYKLKLTGYYYNVNPSKSYTGLSMYYWYIRKYTIQGSNDGINWINIDILTYNSDGSGRTSSRTIRFNSNYYLYPFTSRGLNTNYYSYFRFYINTVGGGGLYSNFSVLNTLKLYGIGINKKYTQIDQQYRQIQNIYPLTDYIAVPTMTSASTIINEYITPSILNGTYRCTSSGYSDNYFEYFAFDSNISTFWNSGINYDSSGNYIGTTTTTLKNTSTIISVSGEWIQIQLPYSLSLSGYRILPRSDYSGQFPKNWYMVGSNDGSNWYVIDYQVNISISNTTIYYNYGNSYGNKNYYSYFRMIIMNIAGTGQNSGITLADIQLQGVGR